MKLLNYIEENLVRLFWFLGLVHVPELEGAPNPYDEIEEDEIDFEEEEDEVRSFKQKTFVIRADGRSKVYQYAAYKEDDIHVGETLQSGWSLEPLDLDAEQLSVFSEWSKYDELVLQEKGWTTEKRFFEYKKIKGAICSGLSYQEICDRFNISMSKVKKYGGLVYRAIEYRRQSDRLGQLSK